MLSARLSGASRFEPPTQAGMEALLTETLGLPVQVGLVRFDLLALGLVVDEAQVEIGSWQLDVPRLLVRPHWMALLEGELRPQASAERFVLRADVTDGAEAAARIPELLEVIGIPEARIRLKGGEVLTRPGTRLLSSLAFDFEPVPGGGRVRIRAREGAAGRLDVQGNVTRQGAFELDVYLDGLETAATGPWLRILPGVATGLELPELAARASGRWHIEISSGGEAEHEFALALHAWEPSDGPPLRRQPTTRLEVAGHLQRDAPAEIGARLVAGSWVTLQGRAERLRLRHAGASKPLLLSGPFEVRLHPFGTMDAPFVVVDARFDGAHLDLPLGFRKPAGMTARLAVVHGAIPGDLVRTRFDLALGSLRIGGRVSRAGVLAADSGWLPLAGLVEVLPVLSQRATGGRLRLASLRASRLGDFEAELEFDEAEWAGPRMPLPVRGLVGTLRLTPTYVGARDLVATLAEVPVRVELSGERERQSGSPWRLRFRAEAESIELADAPAAPSPVRKAPKGDLALPPELVGAAQRQLGFLRDLGVTTKLEIERGVLRCARMRTRGETLRTIEVDMAL
ncbi:MAG: hypothetical protein ABFS46_21520, partial [Myxococcota bacterium]